MIYHLIHQIKNHLNQSKFDRDTYIAGTVLAGMLTKMFIFQFDYSFHLNYLVGMLYGFLFLILLSETIRFTYSYRLCVMLTMVCISLILDGINCISNDAYYITQSFRYEGLLSFSNIYMVVEVICVVSVFRTNVSEWLHNLFSNYSNPIN